MTSLHSPRTLNSFLKMADDDIDFNVTFPSNISRQGYNDDNEKEPVVVLLGWAGCEDRYLSKYSRNIYDNCGFITLRYTAPVEDTVLNSKRLEKKASKLLELLSDLGLNTNPLFIHVLSNGGGRLYRHISEMIHAPTPAINIHLCGTIFDSCPSDYSPWILAKTAFETVKYNMFVKYLSAMTTFVYCYVAPVIELLLSPFMHISLAGSNYWQALIADRARCPQLFLYSKADKLVDYHIIEKFAALRRNLGLEIVQYCWSDSPHVQHYRLYPTAYSFECKTFVNRCLQQLHCQANKKTS